MIRHPERGRTRDAGASEGGRLPGPGRGPVTPGATAVVNASGAAPEGMIRLYGSEVLPRLRAG